MLHSRRVFNYAADIIITIKKRGDLDLKGELSAFKSLFL